MALVYKDRVSQDCTAPATSSPFDFDVGGSTPTGFQSFSTALATNDTCIYSASDSSGNWEVGIGTWSDTTNALTRTTILSSSNSGSAETFSGAVTVEISNDARAMNQTVIPIVNETVTTANVTGVVNTHHVCAIAGLTANRDITIPSGNAGDRIRVTVTDGDADYELIIKGAASQTINGGSAATEWSRLFIAGETVQLVCVAANTWIVEYDGRIPCKADMYVGTTITTNTADTWTQATGMTTVTNIGDLIASDAITLRRAAGVVVTGSAQTESTVSNGYSYAVQIDVGGSAIAEEWGVPGQTTGRLKLVLSKTIAGSAGDAFKLYFRPQEANKGIRQGIADSYLTLTEVLP